MTIISRFFHIFKVTSLINKYVLAYTMNITKYCRPVAMRGGGVAVILEIKKIWTQNKKGEELSGVLLLKFPIQRLQKHSSGYYHLSEGVLPLVLYRNMGIMEV